MIRVGMLLAVLLLCFLPATAQESAAPVENKNSPDLLLNVVVNHATWTVEKVHCRQFPDLADWAAQDDGCLYLGYTQPETHTVYILRDESCADEHNTVLHELMHVAVGVDRSSEKTTIHGAIYVIADHLAEVLHDNPQLGRYFESNCGK